MFEQLFGSKTRVKLLKLFYNNPARQFYVREITRKITEQINSVRRELANLISVGVVQSRTENNRLYYHLNKDFEFYKDFESIFSRVQTADSDENKFAKRIRQIGKVNYAQLSGFFASDANSPVDVFVVGEINRSSLNSLVADLEKENSREINFSHMTLDEYNYRSMLYDRFLAQIMSSPKLVLIDELKKQPAGEAPQAADPGSLPETPGTLPEQAPS